MRLLFQDLKTGTLKLRLETRSDLWRIARLIRVGERVGASTTRRDSEAPEDEPAAHRDRRRVWLVVRAEQVEFHGFSRHVRVSGPIVEGPFDLGRHHTLDVADGDELTIQKESISEADRALLEEGRSARGEAEILLASVDWGTSSLVRLHGRAIETVAEVNRTLAGKRFKGSQGEKDREAYVEELVGLLLREAPRVRAIVIAGPGFLKEELARRIPERAPNLKGRIQLFATAESGGVGIQELLRSGRASEALTGAVAAEEAELVERLVQALGGGRRAAVGAAEVEEALGSGAVETLLVEESILRDPALQSLLDRGRSQNARTFVVRSGEEAGRRLAALGRVGALLRFDWVPSTPRSARRETAS